MSNSNSDIALLEGIFNHVTLPRKLPSVLDGRLIQIEDSLIERLVGTAEELTTCQLGIHWDSLRLSLQTSKALNTSGRLDHRSLLREFGVLQEKEILILQVVEQNAGLLIYKHHKWATQHYNARNMSANSTIAIRGGTLSLKLLRHHRSLTKC